VGSRPAFAAALFELVDEQGAQLRERALGGGGSVCHLA